jgi:hypothetical protein
MNRTFQLVIYPPVWRMGFVVLLAAVCYLTLKPRPQIVGVGFIPGNFAEFFDLYDMWKNVAGFGAMALAGFLGWPKGWGRRKWRPIVRTRVQVYGLFGIVCLMETCQLFIPSRWADGKDILAGGIGVVLAWCGSEVGGRLRYGKRKAEIRKAEPWRSVGGS